MSARWTVRPRPRTSLDGSTARPSDSGSRKPRGPAIRSNTVCPGIVKTRFAEAIWSNEALVDATIKPQPIPRVAEPEEITGVVLLLASDAGSYCTGGVYVVDGGHLL